jgi:hypothetical protein
MIFLLAAIGLPGKNGLRKKIFRKQFWDKKYSKNPTKTQKS